MLLDVNAKFSLTFNFIFSILQFQNSIKHYYIKAKLHQIPTILKRIYNPYLKISVCEKRI